MDSTQSTSQQNSSRQFDFRIKSQPLISPTNNNSNSDHLSFFPAILTNPKLLHIKNDVLVNQNKSKSEGYIGRRRRQIKERDVGLASNIINNVDHINNDDNHEIISSRNQNYKSTFPSPLPHNLLPRNQPVPSSTSTRGRSDSRRTSSGDEGSFYISLRGVRKALAPRGTGSTRARYVVNVTESEIKSWIIGNSSDVVINPDEGNHSSVRILDATPTCYANGNHHHGHCVEQPSITELSRNSNSIVWLIPERFERFVVHCVARWWGVVSFSKTNGDGDRVTHLLKPRLPNDKLKVGDQLQTPPVSEVDSASEANLSSSESSADNNNDRNVKWTNISESFGNVNINDNGRICNSNSDTEESDVERTNSDSSIRITPTRTNRKVIPKPASTHPWKEPTILFSEYLFDVD